MSQVETVEAGHNIVALRRMMVDGQIRTFDVTDQRVLDMFYRVPREGSLPANLHPLTYSDAPLVLPLGGGREGRALMLPMFLAKLLQNATLTGTERVLVVGGASGYAAAILAGLSASVVSLEEDAGLTEAATRYLSALGQNNASAVTGPLALGHWAGAPYDCILVHGAVDEGLATLFEQLAPAGCLLTIETATHHASRRAGKAVRYDRVADGLSRRALFDATMPVLEAFRTKPAFTF